MTTYYIDPTVASGGDGSLATPFNSWDSVTWTAGNTYLQKAGTTYISQITVGASGTSSAPIIMGVYNNISTEDRANVLISTDAVEGIRVSTRNWVVIQDFNVVCDVVNPSGSSIGIHIRQACVNIKVINCIAQGFYYGFLSDNFNLLANSQYNVTYTSCKGIKNWGSGFHCTNACNTITWQKCFASGNGFTTNTTGGHGFTCIAERQNTFTWTLVSGTVYKATITLTNPLLRITNFSSGPSSLTYNAGAGPGATLTLNQWDKDATFVYVNIGTNPTSVSMQAFSNDLYNLKWNRCVAENSVEGYVGEGHGWMVDEGTINSTLNQCAARNNAYDGFQTARSINITFNSCISSGNRQAGFRSNSAASGTAFNFCTSYGNGEEGFMTGSITETTTTTNCLAYQNKGQGYTLRSTSTSNYCCSFANAIADSGGTSTNKITSDPLVNNIGYFKATGSLYKAGIFFGSFTDYENHQRNNPPSVGAYEYVATRGIR